jgi:hypothetical protein
VNTSVSGCVLGQGELSMPALGAKAAQAPGCLTPKMAALAATRAATIRLRGRDSSLGTNCSWCRGELWSALCRSPFLCKLDRQPLVRSDLFIANECTTHSRTWILKSFGALLDTSHRQTRRAFWTVEQAFLYSALYQRARWQRLDGREGSQSPHWWWG